MLHTQTISGAWSQVKICSTVLMPGLTTVDFFGPTVVFSHSLAQLASLITSFIYTVVPLIASKDLYYFFSVLLEQLSWDIVKALMSEPAGMLV